MKPPDTPSRTSLEVLPSDEPAELLDLSPEERLFHEINLLRIERSGKQEFIQLVKMPEGAMSRPITVEQLLSQ